MKLDVVSYIIGKGASSGGGGEPVVVAESFSIASNGSATIPANIGNLIVIGRASANVRAMYWVDITGTPILMAGSEVSISVSDGVITIQNTTAIAIGVSVYYAPWRSN